MSEIEKSLRMMYELGVEHGRELERRDMTIKMLEEQVAEAAGHKLVDEFGESDNPTQS